MVGWILVSVGLLAAASASRADSLDEIKRTLEELQHSRNRDQQEISSLREELRQVKSCKRLEGRLDWMESSVSETRGQLTEVGAAVDRLRSIKPQLHALRAQIKSHAQQMSKFHDQLELIKAQMTANAGTAEPAKDSSRHDDKVENDVDKRPPGRHWRHQKLAEEQAKLIRQQERTESRVDLVVEKMRGLEANLSGETGPLHASLLELLESVQTLQNRLDTALPNIHKQLANADLTIAHQIQQTAIIKEEQDNQRSSVKALSVGLSTLQDALANTRRRPSHDPNTSTTSTTATPSTTTQVARDEASAKKLVDELTQVVSKYEHIVHTLPTDCRGVNEERTAVVRPSGEGDPVLVACSSQGWTLVQRRTDGSVPFNRDWEEYAKGFGTPTGEFWIGNEVLHRLTKDNDTELLIDMEDIYGKRWRAEYTFFSVGPREDGFRMRVAGYRGNATDAMDYQNRMQFSARDSDRDISNTHCANNYEGGWWFSHCQHANLNGRYNLGLTWFNTEKNEWIAVTKSTMKIRPGRSSRTA